MRRFQTAAGLPRACPARRAAVNPFALLAVIALGIAAAFFSQCTADRTGAEADTNARTAGDSAGRDSDGGSSGAASRPASIRIGAWNIEWLGTPDSRSGPAKGHAQSFEDLADYIAYANVSVLALAEVAKDVDGGGWKNEALSAALANVGRRGGGDWDHVLFPATSGRNQLVGVAWDKKRITPVGRSWPLPVAQGNSPAGKPLWSRPPYGQKFSAGAGLTDFVVVPLHMKSDSGGDFAEHRGAEAAALVATLSTARDTMSDLDWVLIGDSNCGEHTEPAVGAFTAAGFVDLNEGDGATHVRWGALDRVFVPADQPEFGRKFAIVRDDYLTSRHMTPEEFKIRLSDHFMVVTEITIGTDDD